jgi:hypothetical protein
MVSFELEADLFSLLQSVLVVRQLSLVSFMELIGLILERSPVMLLKVLPLGFKPRVGSFLEAILISAVDLGKAFIHLLGSVEVLFNNELFGLNGLPLVNLLFFKLFLDLGGGKILIGQSELTVRLSDHIRLDQEVIHILHQNNEVVFCKLITIINSIK